jgi:hypothetical protein
MAGVSGPGRRLGHRWPDGATLYHRRDYDVGSFDEEAIDTTVRP